MKTTTEINESSSCSTGNITFRPDLSILITNTRIRKAPICRAVPLYHINHNYNVLPE